MPAGVAVRPDVPGPISSSEPPTRATLTHAATAVAIKVNASATAGRRLRSAREAPTKEPSARPVMKDVSVAAKA